ncbi:MAG: hypothetical protein GY822_09625 [Deltaproteobacteria bacterium]|nr:hypothetical protein [Deltaproteobacteria bacterium]
MFLLLFGFSNMLSNAVVAQVPHRSFDRVSFSNGHAVASYNSETAEIDTFLERSYRFLEPLNPDAADLCFSAIESRDLLFDAYFGVRSSDGTVVSEWLAELPLPADASAQPALLLGTGILETAQLARTDDLIVRTFSFFPMALASPTLVQMLEVTNNGSAALDVTAFSLMNAHLGDAFGGREPTSINEQVIFDETRQAFYEFSDDSQGTMAYVALSNVAHATASSGAAGGYTQFLAGAELDDNKNTIGAVDDVTPAFQGQTLTLGPGEQASFAVAMVWALDEDEAPDVDALLAFWTSRGANERLFCKPRQKTGTTGIRRRLLASILRCGETQTRPYV